MKIANRYFLPALMVSGQANHASNASRVVVDFSHVEKQAINLVDRTYRVVEEGHLWHMCGYK